MKNLLKIMFVDDEVNVLRGMRNSYDWDALGFTIVGEAGSAALALSLARQNQPDVVITDICMDGKDGLTLISELKEQNPAIHVAAVEPADSPVLSGGKAGPHKLQGIGAGFVPDALDQNAYDEVLTVTTEQAFEASRALGRAEGVLAGISSGAALAGAIRLAKLPENAGKTIVTLLPDTGDRYLSTGLFTAEG